MEKIDKDPKKETERSVLPKNQKAKTGFSTQKAENKPNEEDTKQPKREEEQERTKMKKEPQQSKDAAGITMSEILQPEVKPPSTKSKIQALLRQTQSLEEELKIRQKEREEKMKKMTEKHKRTLEECEKVKKQIKHFAAVDARRFREVVQMAEEERKQQVEKILANNEKICKHLGIPWKRPDLPFMEQSAPIQPRKQALKPNLPMETVKKLMEQLCDEEGFLMESKLQQLLAPLDKEDQTIEKLNTIFQTLGMEGKDMPDLADFLLKYKEEHGVQTEDVCAESSDGAKAAETSRSTNMSSKVIHCSSVLPALNSFVKQRVESRVGHAEAGDLSELKAYWDSMANVIPEEKRKMWKEAEKMFRQYHAVLKDIFVIRARNERLQQRNTELRALVEQKRAILTSPK